MNINIVLLLLPFLLVVPTYARLNAAGNKDLLTELSEEEYLSKKGGRGEGGRGDEQQIASLSSVMAAVVDEDIVVEGEDDGDSDDDFFPDVPCKCDTFPYIFCPAPIQCEEECGNRSLCNFCFMSTKVGTSCDCSALPWPLC
mmetsp:Transcript_2249/g.3201  ORF Transcript_2249/g.3201 Transcript_2249/m.3201 type:complete len:142 (+) Transcript_2249:23-448(+)